MIIAIDGCFLFFFPITEKTSAQPLFCAIMKPCTISTRPGFHSHP